LLYFKNNFLERKMFVAPQVEVVHWRRISPLLVVAPQLRCGISIHFVVAPQLRCGISSFVLNIFDI
jgi:hypothetical protein